MTYYRFNGELSNTGAEKRTPLDVKLLYEAKNIAGILAICGVIYERKKFW